MATDLQYAQVLQFHACAVDLPRMRSWWVLAFPLANCGVELSLCEHSYRRSNTLVIGQKPPRMLPAPVWESRRVKWKQSVMPGLANKPIELGTSRISTIPLLVITHRIIGFSVSILTISC